MDQKLYRLQPAVEEAGEALVKLFFTPGLVFEEKGAENFVSEADRISNGILVAWIRSTYPDDAIWSEEGPQETGSHRWIIDPLDGTHNFKLGKPEIGISVAYEEDGVIRGGIVYNPLSGQWFSADGVEAWYAFHDSDFIPTEVSIHRTFKDAYISYTPGYCVPEPHFIDVCQALQTHDPGRVLNGWCPAFELGLLASGRIHACILQGVALHDYAAGAHIATIAGARSVPLSRRRFGGDGHFVLASSQELAELLAVVVDALP